MAEDTIIAAGDLEQLQTMALDDNIFTANSKQVHVHEIEMSLEGK